ncbi:TetR/AcrR family transcriptional regulator [Saccharopolyspora spinosporotrichia]
MAERSRGGMLPIIGQRPTERADAARNRRKILLAASRLIAENGAEHLSLDEVADAAQVGVGTVYRRFRDRAGLVQSLLDERERQFQEAFMQGPPPLGPGRRRWNASAPSCTPWSTGSRSSPTCCSSPRPPRPRSATTTAPTPCATCTW